MSRKQNRRIGRYRYRRIDHRSRSGRWSAELSLRNAARSNHQEQGEVQPREPTGNSHHVLNRPKTPKIAPNPSHGSVSSVLRASSPATECASQLSESTLEYE